MQLHWVLFGCLWVASLVGCLAQAPFYQRPYFNPIQQPSTNHYYQRPDGFVPISYGNSDLMPGETKHRESVKRYPNLIPFTSHSSEEDDSSREVYSSGEYSNEASAYASNSKEGDSNEYAIGTHIRVQHPITVPKKATSSSRSHKQSRYHKSHKASNPYTGELNLSTEFGNGGGDHLPDLLTVPSSKKHSSKYSQSFGSEGFHVVSPPKSSASSTHSSYSVYEPEHEDYEPSHHSSSLPSSSSSSSSGRSKSRDRFKGATKKQIDAFLKDQKKLLDEALKSQLLTNPDYQKYLKAKVKDAFEDDDGPSGPPQYRPNFDENLTFKPNRPRRRPPPKRSPKVVPLKPRRRYRAPIVLNVS